MNDAILLTLILILSAFLLFACFVFAFAINRIQDTLRHLLSILYKEDKK